MVRSALARSLTWAIDGSESSLSHRLTVEWDTPTRIARSRCDSPAPVRADRMRSPKLTQKTVASNAPHCQVGRNAPCTSGLDSMSFVAKAKGPSSPVSERWAAMARDAMQRKSLSAREMGRRIKRSHTAVTRTLSGQPSSRVAVLMAKELDIPPPTIAVDSRAVESAVEDKLDPAEAKKVAARLRRLLLRLKTGA